MWTKVCGIRDVETGLAVAECGPQAIGLNFFAASPRAVAVETAAQIASRLLPSVEPVGVFVNHSAQEIRRIAERCRLRTVQLHGDEPPELLAELGDLRIVRAFRVKSGEQDGDPFHEIEIYLRACRVLRVVPWACLIDARVDGAYGGTGRCAPWELTARAYRRGEWPPLILAGGLHAGNVAEAIRIVRPWGVDVAGGVESSLACKDVAQVRNFLAAATN